MANLSETSTVRPTLRKGAPRLSADELAQILALHRLRGMSARAIAARLGRSPSAVAKAIRDGQPRARRTAQRELAAVERRRRRDRERKRRQRARDRARAQGRTTVPATGEPVNVAPAIIPPSPQRRVRRPPEPSVSARRRSGSGYAAFLDRRDYERSVREANLRAGLSPDGFCVFEYPGGRGTYEPGDPADVARVRKLMADAGVHDWEPLRLAR